MQMKKIFSIAVCLFMLFPLFIKIAEESNINNIYINSGIGNYYASVSSAAFKMIDIVMSDFMGLDSVEFANKNAPSKSKDTKEEAKANTVFLIFDNPAQKIIKTTVLLSIVYINEGISIHMSTLGSFNDGPMLAMGWMTVLILLLILSVRKKDDIIAFFEYKNKKHPISV